ncbi:TolC family protein [bacterium]|nr:TolC family protein [bacterium]
MLTSFLSRLLLCGVACLLLYPAILRADSPPLARLLALADSASPALLEARLAVAEARANHTSARGFPNPAVFFESEDLSQDGIGSRESTVGVRQNLGFLWAQTPRASAARLAYEAALAQYEEQRRRLNADLVLALTRLRQLEIECRFLDSLLAVTDELLRHANARQQAGDLSDYDTERIRLEAIELNSRYAAALEAEQEVKADLTRRSGLSFALFEPAVLSEIPAPEFSDAGAAVHHAYSHRPLLREQEIRRTAAERNRTAASRNRLPDLSVALGQKKVVDGPEGFVWEVALELPLFHQRRSATTLARDQAGNAATLYESSKRTVEQDVRSAYAQWQALTRFGSEHLHGVGQRAQANLKLAVSLYLNGESGSLDLVDALRTGIDALTAAHELELGRTRAALHLRLATGLPLLEN